MNSAACAPARLPERVERLSLSAAGESTEVLLGTGLLARAPELLARWRSARVFLVSDDVVGPLHAERSSAALAEHGFTLHDARVPSGEAAKSLDVLARLYAECQSAGLERRDVVVALGGGAVGDVAGMLAGTYLRGLDFVQVPTTLVAMATASVGGKVGVNFGGAKNLVGLFKQPALVLADLDLLRTLPEAEFRSGLGELVTVGVLGAPALYAALEARAARAPLGPAEAGELLPLVAEAVRCKAALVEADPFDRSGVRARLNLGHTFGHAFETLSGFTLPHGLAVALGLLTAARLAAAAGLCAPELPARLRRTLRALELPLALGGLRLGDVLAALRADKKRSGGRLRFVLPRRVGDVALVAEDELPAGALEAALQRTLAGAAAEEES